MSTYCALCGGGDSMCNTCATWRLKLVTEPDPRESEIAALREQLAETKKLSDDRTAQLHVFNEEIGKLRSQLAAITKERDDLRRVFANAGRLDDVTGPLEARLAESRATNELLTEEHVKLQRKLTDVSIDLRRTHEALDRRDREIRDLDEQNRALTLRLRSERGAK